ncbi:MAG: ABC transporter ATP-binding protein [Nanoarchaeota archaeon]
MPQPPYIELQKVSKKFGKNLVLDNIDLSIPFGEITGIIGASGSGKTTILNLLIGFYKQTSGKIKFQGRDIHKDYQNISMIFGFATQGGSFYNELSVEENLCYFGKLYNLSLKEIKSRADNLLRLLELENARKFLARSLSTGMQRRLDIACALIHNPKVLILDEPTEDLDPLLRREVIEVLKRVKNTGTTIILTSHLLGEIENLCDKIAILHKGRIMKFDSPATLKKLYGKNSLEEIFISIIKEGDKLIAKTLVSSALQQSAQKSSVKSNISRNKSLEKGEDFQKNKGFTFWKKK